jgi:hypothetical protein
MVMNEDAGPARIRKWLANIANTQDEEVDCDTLESMLERLVAIGESGADIREVLPDIALHLDHCPECGEWYEVLLAMCREQP